MLCGVRPLMCVFWPKRRCQCSLFVSAVHNEAGCSVSICCLLTRQLFKDLNPRIYIMVKFKYKHPLCVSRKLFLTNWNKFFFYSNRLTISIINKLYNIYKINIWWLSKLFWFAFGVQKLQEIIKYLFEMNVRTDVSVMSLYFETVQSHNLFLICFLLDKKQII